MKKIFKLLSIGFLLFLSQKTFSQIPPFAPIGAEWHYAMQRDIFHFYRFGDDLKLKVTDDTLIMGKICSKIETSSLMYYDDSIHYTDYSDSIFPILYNEYLYQSGDTVYRYMNDSSFTILYIWNAEIGDTFTTRLYDVSDHSVMKYRMKVYDKGLVWLNGIEHRALGIGIDTSMHYISTPYLFMGDFFVSDRFNIIERLGCTSYLFPWTSHWLDAYVITGLRCYEDSTFYFNSGLVSKCDSVELPLSIFENEKINELRFYPNPVQSIITFETEHILNNYLLYDMQMKLLKTGSVINQQINLSDMGSGIYFLKIIDQQGKIGYNKFYKE